MAGYRGWQGKKIGLFEPRFDDFWRASTRNLLLVDCLHYSIINMVVRPGLNANWKYFDFTDAIICRLSCARGNIGVALE
jgi:hypothetical protein